MTITLDHAARRSFHVRPVPLRPQDPIRFDDLVRALHAVAARIDAEDADAEAALHSLMAQLQLHADPRCTGLYVFASALAQRLAGSASTAANLYLRRFEVPQIELFNLLGRHVPMVGMATRIANDTLAQAMLGQAHPTLIDVGIGTGRQFAALLGDLATAGRLPKRLTIIGIEPAAAALGEAQATLAALADRLGVALHFVGFASSAEALGDADWQAMAAACTGRPLVNAAFALHHIADDAQGHEQRSRVLRRLRALQPACMVLCEPDVDHREPRFLPRFRHCFAHFSAVFGVLDRLPLAQADRDALKVGFFGREIVDVLATPEPQRSERHEATAAWLQRLAETGFVAQQARLPLPANAPGDVRATQQLGHVAIQAGLQPLVSMFIATA